MSRELGAGGSRRQGIRVFENIVTDFSLVFKRVV